MKPIKLLFFLFFIFSCSSDDKTEDEMTENPIENPNSENPFKIVDGIKIGVNYIIFEPNVTTSDLGLWINRVPGDSEYHTVANDEIDAINNNYLEFTGNNLNSGPPTSPLSYTFTCPKTAEYRLVMRMYQNLEDGEEDDKRNDVWIKLQGDFTTACIYSTEDLKTDHKFWGRGVRKWGSTYRLEGEVNNEKRLDNVVYNLTEGETYTFTMSGRAQGCGIDYVVFYEESLENQENQDFKVVLHTDLASELPEFLRP